MDVKDLQGKSQTSQQAKSSEARSSSQQRPLTSLGNQRVQTTATQTEASVFVARKVDVARTKEREKVNEAINAKNQIQLVSDRVSELVNSIEGIVEQAGGKEVSPRKRELLQREGNELIDEIKTEVGEVQLNEVPTLGGDDIRGEIEKSFEAVRKLLPNGQRDAFGIGEIKLDEIVDTRTKIAEAQEQLQQLREAVSSTSSAIGQAVQELEVAIANTEASEASIRDVEEAIKAAADTKLQIGSDRTLALGAVSKLDPSSVDLL